MNRKEIAEIRKQFSIDRCAITRICSCYVDGEKNKCTSMKEAFLSLPEEEMFKYLDMFKKTLNGKLDKNLLNMKFSLQQELDGECQSELLDLRNSKLADEELVEEFYDKVIENYICGENYYIVLVHGAYDIPGRTSDNKEMFDASEDVYEFIMCCICPVKLSKGGLSYDADKNRMENRTRDWVVDMPAHGFLFPAFNGRSTDIHGGLYYSKKPDSVRNEFVKAIFGAEIKMSVEDQKEAFDNMVAEVLGGDGDVRDLLSIHENLREMLSEHEFDADPLSLDKEAFKRLIESSVADKKCTERFDSAWNAWFEKDASLPAENIVGCKKIKIQCGDAEIQVDVERTDFIKTESINGELYLTVPVNGLLAVNGVQVNLKEEVRNE